MTTNVETPTRRWRVETNDFPGKLSWSRTSGRLAVAQGEGPILLLDANTGEMIRQLDGHAMGVTTISTIANGDLLLSAGYDGKVKVWNFADGNLDVEISVGRGWVDMAKASPDGELIAATCGKLLHIFKIDGTPIMESDWHKHAPTVMDWDRQGKFLATGCQGFFLTWNRKESIEKGLPDNAIDLDFGLTSLSLDPRGRWAAAGSSDNGLRLISLVESAQDFAAGPYQRLIATMSWSTGGRWLATPNGAALAIFDSEIVGSEDRSTFKLSEVHQERIEKISFHPERETMFASGDHGGRVIVHNAENSEVLSDFVAGTTPIADLIWVGDNGLAVADEEGIVQLFEFQSIAGK